MDFERIAIQTLFYDYPVELAVEVLDRQDDQYLRSFEHIAKWKDIDFSVSEWRLLVQMLKDSWFDNHDADRTASLGRFLLALEKVSSELMSSKSDEPLVRFEHLFRWRDVTLCLGEDELIIPYIAKRDVENRTTRTEFCWPDIIHHDNAPLNQQLSKGLSDVHAHYNATTDIFHLNWISLMNRLDAKIYGKLDERFSINQERGIPFANIMHIIPYKRLCAAAAFLRLNLFAWLKGDVASRNLKDVARVLKEEDYSARFAGDLRAEINNYRSESLKTSMHHAYDYAIPSFVEDVPELEDISTLYYGERKLMYDFFFLLYKGDKNAWDMAQYMYLYLLLKNRIRRTLIQTNKLIGFENFNIYQRRKSAFVDNNDMFYWVAPQLIYQTSVSKQNLEYLEARVAPGSVQRTQKNRFGTAVFTNEIVRDNVSDHLSFIAHFIKQEEQKKLIEGDVRHKRFRIDIQTQLNQLLELYQSQKKTNKERPLLVGIDAASSELECRPEVFGHLFRFAERCGMYNRTYHVGEDFYDLSDGIRAVDEAILFLHLGRDCRIGHGLALSENAYRYYHNRRYNVVISKQALLDDCVWMYYKAKEYDIVYPSSLEIFLVDTAARLYNEIGYLSPFNMLQYWHSMLLRGDELDTEAKDKALDIDLWQLTSVCIDKRLRVAQKDKDAYALYEQYQTSLNVKENGRKICTERFPHSISQLVDALQKAMRRDIAEQGICVECCPSSNLKIGHFARYDEHPIFTFRPICPKPADPIVNVSINTDDRGVFATSLYNEYSLIALAMTKMKDENGHRKYNDETVLNYIEHVRVNGFTQRFR